MGRCRFRIDPNALSIKSRFPSLVLDKSVHADRAKPYKIMLRSLEAQKHSALTVRIAGLLSQALNILHDFLTCSSAAMPRQ